MQLLGELVRRLGMLWRRRELERDLAEEMDLHIELRREERVREGVAAEAAGTAARRQFGNIGVIHEASRDAWGWTWLEQAAQDVRYGVRGMMRNPGFSLLAVLILGAGIGASTAIFSVVHAVLIRPLDYHDPDRLVTLLHGGTGAVSPANYRDWREQSTSFEDMAAGEYWTPNLTGTDSPEKLWALRLTPNLLPMLGVKPLFGRTFAEGEDQEGAGAAVVLSHAIWQRRFASDRAILGRAILLDGVPHTVIGVMPAGFRFAPFWATRTELWAPLALAGRMNNRDGNSLRIFARLKPSADLARARSEIAAITTRLERQYPGSNRNVVVTPLKENVVGKVDTPLRVALGAVGFVLLIACANVAHMLLARSASRQREISLRAALGAGRHRLLRQFLTEGLLLAVCGAAAGLGFAALAIRTIALFGREAIPRLAGAAIDPRVALFCLVTGIITGVLFSLAPAFHARTLDLTGALKAGTKGGGGSRGLARTRKLLTVSEIALAFVLLIGAGLLIRSFSALRSLDPGFEPAGVLSMVVSVAGSSEGEPGRREAFYRTLMDRVGALPGVVSAGAINHVPLAGDIWTLPFAIEGRPKPRPGESPAAVYRIVMPGYFETMRLPIVRGRGVTVRDDARSPGVVVISEEAARSYWPGEDPLGKRITFDSGGHSTWLTIAGVARDARQREWSAAPAPEMYLAALQNPGFLSNPRTTYISLVVRTAGDPAALAPMVESAVWALNPSLPVSEVVTMKRAVSDATAQPRFEVMLLTVFAGIALLLAAAGIYALISYSVSQRVREIGIRIALGAGPGKVAAGILREGLVLGLTGSAVGVVGALLLTRLMAGMLFGVRPADPVTFAAAGLVLGCATLAAAFFPSRRAARVDPQVALRQE